MNIIKLPSYAKKFLTTNFIAHVIYAFIRFFINIYLWRITENLALLVIYNIVYEIVRIIAFIPSGKITKEKSRFIPLRTGFILEFLFLLLITLLGPQITNYFIYVAIIGGFARGFYVSADNQFKFDVCNSDNRITFSLYGTILKSLAYTFTPFLASLWIIKNSSQDLYFSYIGIFITGMIITLLGLLSTFNISNTKKFNNSKYDLIKASKIFIKNKNTIIGAQCNVLRYVADILPILISLILFTSTKTEFSIGKYQLITGLVAMLSLFIIKKFPKIEPNKLLIYGGIIKFLITFILLFRQDYSTLLIYGILYNILSISEIPLYPKILDTFNSICKDKEECLNLRVEFITFSEIFVGIGNVIGFSLLLLISNFNDILSISIVAIIMAATQLLANLNIVRVKKQYDTQFDDMN